MAVTSVTVTGTLKLPSGQPAAFATVRFVLSSPALLGLTVVIPQSVTTTADATGTFNVALIPNSKFAYYAVTVCRASGVVLFETVAVIPNIDCQFSQVIQARQSTSISASVAALDALQNAQAGIESARLQVIAVSTTVNSGSQAALLQLQTAVNTYEALLADNQNTLEALVDTATGTSIDLVTAYQLST